MENLHLKNLKELDLINNNLEKIHELNIKLEKLSTVTLEYLINELRQINISNPTINKLKHRYLQNIIKNKYIFTKEKQLKQIQEFINEIDKLKDITLNSKINPQDYELYFRKYNRYTKNIEIEIINCALFNDSNHQTTWLTLRVTYNKLNNNIQSIEIEETYYK
jgi:hypothetical protein